MHLSPELELYIQEKLAAGSFVTREELTERAFAVYRRMEQKHVELKSLVQEQIEAVERGEVEEMDFDAFKAKLLTELDEQGKPRQ